MSAFLDNLLQLGVAAAVAGCLVVVVWLILSTMLGEDEEEETN